MNLVKRKRLFSAIIGGAVFSYCIYYMFRFFQWKSIVQVLLQVDLLWLLGAGSSTILIYWLLRTVRLFFMLKAIDVHIHFFRLYLVGSTSMAFAVITPFQSGEAIKIELLKKSGDLDRIPGYAIFAAEKILDLIVVLFLAALSIFFGVSKLMDENVLLIVSVTSLIGFSILFAITQRIAAAGFLSRFFQPFNQCIKNRRSLLMAIFLTIGGWLVVALGWYCCLRSISISLTIFQTIALTSIVTVVNVLSFIPGAVGVSEVSIAAFLIYLQQGTSISQAGAVVLRIFGLLSLVLGLLHFLMILITNTKKINLKNTSKLLG